MKDLSLVHFVIALCSAVSAAFLWLNWRIHYNLSGTKAWALYGICLTTGNVLLALQAQLPSEFAIVFANLLIFTCSYFFASGTAEFYRQPMPDKMWMALMAVCIPIGVWYTLVESNILVRLTLNYVVSSVSLFIALRAILAATRTQQRSLAEHGFMFAIWLIWGALTARMVLLGGFNAGDTVLATTQANQVFTIIIAIVPLIASYSMCLLCSGRRESMLSALQAKSEFDAKRKSRFLAMLSHELRTPLNAIVGHANMLKRVPHEPAKHRQLCDIIENAAVSLADLANQVLLQAKGEQQQSRSHVLSLSNLLEPLFTLLRPLAEQKGLQFSYQIAPAYQSMRFVLEREPLQLVIKNLLSNAIKYTEQGHILLTVNCEEFNGEKPLLTFTVSDTGPGISPAMLDKLFDPFVTGGAEESIADGAGLGLALCQQLLSNMNTRMQVESIIGEGSCFRFTIHAEIAHEPTSAAVVTHPKFTSVQGECAVLVIEDVELNQKVIAHYLQQAHCRFHIAASLAQATQQLQKTAFDVVLLDMRLPDGHGLEWLAKVVPNLKLMSQPVFVALTGDVSAADRYAYQQAGIIACLDKPIEPQALYSLLRQILGEVPHLFNSLLDTQVIDQLLRAVESQYLHTKLMYLSDTYDYELAQLQGLADIEAHEALAEKLNRLANESAALGMRELAQQLTALEQQVKATQDVDWHALHQCARGSIQELQAYCYRVA